MPVTPLHVGPGRFPGIRSLATRHAVCVVTGLLGALGLGVTALGSGSDRFDGRL